MGYTREIYGECIVFTSNMHNMYSLFTFLSSQNNPSYYGFQYFFELRF